MKSIFEKQLLCESTFSIEDEKVATKTIMESYISGETPLEELCEEIGLSEDLKKYRNGELSDEEMAARINEGFLDFVAKARGGFGLGRAFDNISTAWNAGGQQRRLQKFDANQAKLQDRYAANQEMIRRRLEAAKDPSRYRSQIGSKLLNQEDIRHGKSMADQSATAHARDRSAQKVQGATDQAVRAGIGLDGAPVQSADDIGMNTQLNVNIDGVEQALKQTEGLVNQYRAAPPAQRAALAKQIAELGAQMQAEVQSTLNRSDAGKRADVTKKATQAALAGGRKTDVKRARRAGSRVKDQQAAQIGAPTPPVAQ